ncbi:MAG TPA: PQQ-dependent sugar dehydrogenase [Actinomycetota bacterium]|nr:PQQ-dependent sugar dehydrogenase [Actinomycetota bacterium]
MALLTAGCSAKKAKTGASPSAAASVTATVTATASQPAPSPSPSTATPTRPAVSPSRPTSPAPTKPATTAPPAAPAGLSGPPASAFPLAANFPTALAFAPDGRLFWTERAGNVMVYQNGAPRVFARVSTVTTEPGGGYSERGLLGLALSPTFGTDHFVYAFYSDANRSTQHVVRWTDSGGTGTASTTILTFPAGDDCCHKGGRLVFGPTDGKLYVTLGEEHNPDQAQNVGSPLGKVLRYNPDGSVPADDPFAAQGSAAWAYGFRNPFGIAISSSGQMALTVNGPTGDDGSPSTGYDTVIFSVRKGGDYQWPECYGYSHPLEANPCPGSLIAPDYSTEASTFVPTGATFVDGAGPAGAAGHLVFCTFNNGGMIYTPDSPHGSVAAGPADCRLDIKQGPDHALYYSDTGHIYRS